MILFDTDFISWLTNFDVVSILCDIITWFNNDRQDYALRYFMFFPSLQHSIPQIQHSIDIFSLSVETKGWIFFTWNMFAKLWTFTYGWIVSSLLKSNRSFFAFSIKSFYLFTDSSSVFQKLFPIWSIDSKIWLISFVIFYSRIKVNESVMLQNSL